MSNTETLEKYANAAFADITNALSANSVDEILQGDSTQTNFNTTLPIGAAPTVTRSTPNRPPADIYTVIPQSVINKDLVPVSGPPFYDWQFDVGSSGLSRPQSATPWDVTLTYAKSQRVKMNDVEYSSFADGNMAHVPPFTDWNGGITYNLADTCKVGGQFYISLYNGNLDPGDGSHNPTLGVTFWYPLDTWNPSTTYEVWSGTSPQDNSKPAAAMQINNLYLCQTAGSGISPELNPAHWSIQAMFWQYTTLQTGERLEVVYTPEIGLYQQYIYQAIADAMAAVMSGSGEFDDYQSTDNTVPFVVVAGTNIAAMIAAAYNEISQEVDVVSYRDGLEITQGITLGLPKIDAVGSYVVISVKMQDKGQYAVWTMKLAAGAFIGDWKNAIGGLSGNAVAAGAAGGGSSSGGIASGYNVM